MWSQLAVALKGHAGVAGYDIMNEPSNMPSPATWPAAAQAAVDAIRAVDMQTPIYVEGDHWATAANWTQFNGNLHINDLANKIIYEAHVYFDSNGSGQYTQTYDQQGATPNTGVQDVQSFLGWLQANHYQGFVGELGIPANDPKWLPVLNNVLDALQAAGVSATVWNYVYADPSGANSWWPVTGNGDHMSIDPNLGWGAQTMELIFAHTAPSIGSFSATTGNLTGTAAAGSTVKIYDGSTLLGNTTADASGAWSFHTVSLVTGSHSLTATATDAAGTTSEASAVMTLTIGPGAPARP